MEVSVFRVKIINITYYYFDTDSGKRFFRRFRQKLNNKVNRGISQLFELSS